MSWQMCIKIPSTPDPMELLLPGGISIKHTNLEALLQPAIAPLGPAFLLVESVTAIASMLKSLTDAITSVPPDFTAAARALEKVATIPPSLAKLSPPLAAPVMIVNLIDVALRATGQMRSEILQLQQQTAGLLVVEQTAQRLQDTRLLAVFECCKVNIEQEAANLGKSMASLGHILGLISLLGSLAGLTLSVPDLAGCGARPLDQALTPLDEAVSALAALRTMVPLP